MAARNVSMDWTTKRSVSATRLRESGLVTSVRGVSTSARMKKAPARAAAQPLARVSWDGEMRLPPCALASWRTMPRPHARRVRRLYKRSSRLPLLRRNLKDNSVNKDQRESSRLHRSVLHRKVISSENPIHANFPELRKTEVQLRSSPVPRTRVNKGRNATALLGNLQLAVAPLRTSPTPPLYGNRPAW